MVLFVCLIWKTHAWAHNVGSFTDETICSHVRFAQLFLQGCAFVHGYVVGSTRVFAWGHSAQYLWFPAPLPMWAFSRKLGFLPQFIDKHVTLTGGSLVFCKGVVTKLFSCLSPTNCWEGLQHQPLTQHRTDGQTDGREGGREEMRRRPSGSLELYQKYENEIVLIEFR